MLFVDIPTEHGPAKLSWDELKLSHIIPSGVAVYA